jgi:hypothetical protein
VFGGSGRLDVVLHELLRFSQAILQPPTGSVSRDATYRASAITSELPVTREELADSWPQCGATPSTINMRLFAPRFTIGEGGIHGCSEAI